MTDKDLSRVEPAESAEQVTDHARRLPKAGPSTIAMSPTIALSQSMVNQLRARLEVDPVRKREIVRTDNKG